jgi:hypothetical protein
MSRCCSTRSIAAWCACSTWSSSPRTNTGRQGGSTSTSCRTRTDSTWASGEGAFSGLLDESDVNEIGSQLQAGSVAAIVVYENLWTVTLDDVLHGHGARLIADGRIAPEDVLAALDEADKR